jgi:beta-glucanase (GH16 family)
LVKKNKKLRNKFYITIRKAITSVLGDRIMKLFSSITFLILLVSCLPSHQASSVTINTIKSNPTKGYSLVWDDEFNQPDGSSPDKNKWNYSTGGNGWGNSELECYTNRTNNSFINKGMLVIQAEQEEYMGCKYTSARLNTLTKGNWKYARFEIRAKLPTTEGIWPALWLLPSNITRYGSWPASGEIDIMELIGKEPGRVTGTLHFGNPHTSITNNFDLPVGVKFSDDFHIFTLDWEPTKINWYVDGKLYQTANQWFTSVENSPFPAPFDVEFYLIMNVAVGGNWPGNPDATSTFPQSMDVDYVRVYQIIE